MNKSKVVILATEGLTTNLLYEKLSQEFEVIGIILEEKESKWKVIKRRFKKPGFFSAIGQIMFMIFIKPFLKYKRRVKNILKEHNYKGVQLPVKLIHRIESVNSNEMNNLVTSLKPELIFLNGTRIVASKHLEKIPYPVVNIHVGITPKYRGIHGGYWALYEGHPELFGTTLHYVDAGIDTGDVIDRIMFTVTKKDNFRTYPILQYIKGLELIDENKETLLSGKITASNHEIPGSKLHYHPRFIQYIWKRITKGVR